MVGGKLQESVEHYGKRRLHVSKHVRHIPERKRRRTLRFAKTDGSIRSPFLLEELTFVLLEPLPDPSQYSFP